MFQVYTIVVAVCSDFDCTWSFPYLSTLCFDTILLFIIFCCPDGTIEYIYIYSSEHQFQTSGGLYIYMFCEYKYILFDSRGKFSGFFGIFKIRQSLSTLALWTLENGKTGYANFGHICLIASLREVISSYDNIWSKVQCAPDMSWSHFFEDFTKDAP